MLLTSCIYFLGSVKRQKRVNLLTLISYSVHIKIHIQIKQAFYELCLESYSFKCKLCANNMSNKELHEPGNMTLWASN